MPWSLPFLKSDSNYTLIVPVDDVQYLFDVRWNSRDEAFYLDIYESDDSIVAINIKVVLGAQIGRASQHDFFNNYVITIIDTSGENQDASFDDLGNRIQVLIQSIE